MVMIYPMIIKMKLKLRRNANVSLDKKYDRAKMIVRNISVMNMMISNADIYLHSFSR